MNTIKTQAKIALVNAIANTNEIRISSSCTIYIHENFENEICINDLIVKHDNLIKLARKNKIKCSLKYKTKQQLKDLITIYSNCYDDYKDNYFKLLAIAQELIHTRLYAPTCDNELLKKLYKIRNKIKPLFYHSGIFSQLLELKRSIIQAEEFVDNLIVDKEVGVPIQAKIFL